jgi:heme exporter protein C
MKMDHSPPNVRLGTAVLDWLLVLLSLSVPAALYMALTYPPPEITQGQAHRIFYIHVPIAWVALYAPLLSALCGILYLIKRNSAFDEWSVAANRIALLFALGVVISGPVWAKAIWGVYWDWTDERLMSFFILLLSLGGYFYARSLATSPEKRARISAILSIIAAISAVTTWFAIRLVEPQQHPRSLLGAMAPAIRLTFWVNVLAFHFLFLAFFRVALRLERNRSSLEKSL